MLLKKTWAMTKKTLCLSLFLPFFVVVWLVGFWFFVFTALNKESLFLCAGYTLQNEKCLLKLSYH